MNVSGFWICVMKLEMWSGDLFGGLIICYNKVWMIVKINVCFLMFVCVILFKWVDLVVFLCV